MGRFRWWLWSTLCRLPQVCPANAHGVLIWRTRNDPRIDGACRCGCADNGACWCGKLRDGAQ